MSNLFFHGQRELSTGLQLQQKDQNGMAGNLFTITDHIYIAKCCWRAAKL